MTADLKSLPGDARRYPFDRAAVLDATEELHAVHALLKTRAVANSNTLAVIAWIRFQRAFANWREAAGMQ